MSRNKRSGRQLAGEVLGFTVLAGVGGWGLPAQAEDFSFTSERFGDFQFSWNNRLTAGAAVRVEGRNYNIIDKQNVPGQSTLCGAAPPTANPALVYTEGDCHSVFGDPALSRQLLDARGSYNINGDQGDLNYGVGDVTYSGVSLRSTLAGSWRNFTFKLGALGIYDPVNSHFNTYASDIKSYPDHPQVDENGVAVKNPDGTTKLIDIQRPTRRSSSLETLSGRQLRLLEAFVSGDFAPWGEAHKLRLAVGNQYLHWGESTFVLFNTLNQVNPLSAPLYRFPGSEVKDAFLPTNMVTASVDLLPKVTLSGFYQLTWEPTEPDVAGTYLSVSNVANGGDGPIPVYLSASNTPVDPLGQFVPGQGDNAFTTGSRTAYLEGDHRPHNGGQFGFRLDYYADWLNGGTELSAYAMNIHSRLPYFSAYAANQSCFTPYVTTGAGGGTAFTNGLASCKTLYGVDPNSSASAVADIRKNYAYPVNTLRPFLDYPEDIHIFGASFNTTVSDWSLAGEITYSPNQPAQVSVVDVVYAGLQPALPDTDPAQEQLFNTRVNGGLSAIEYPTNRIFIPDYLETVYRNHKVQAGDYVQGYERLQVGQIDLTGIRIFSGSNWIHANQITFVGELAAIKVFNLPSLNQLQFETFPGRELHYSTAQSEFDPNATYAGTPGNFYGDRRINQLDVANPERASASDFADDFAWGYRLRLQATYNDVWRNIALTPGVDFYHDVHGTSIAPGQDFVQGRLQGTFSNEFKFSQNFSSLLRYVMFAGGGYHNTRIDRDYVELSATYSF